MIEIKDARRRYGNDWCNSCLSDDNTKRISISVDGLQASSFVLCSKCRDELARKLVMTDTYEETDQKGGTENRQEAIERLKELVSAITLYVTEAKLDKEEVENELLNIEALKMAIDALQDDWIPVSERLPKCEQEVLICTET